LLKKKKLVANDIDNTWKDIEVSFNEQMTPTIEKLILKARNTEK